MFSYSETKAINDKTPIVKPHISSASSSRLSPRSARTSTLELSDDMDGESESDRFSLSDDEDIYAGEEAENKSSKQGKAPANEQNNNSVHRASEYEEEIIKSAKLTPDQIREIKEAFHVFDNNGDGCITATELKKLVTSLGYNITEAELMDMMNQIGECHRVNLFTPKNNPGSKLTSYYNFILTQARTDYSHLAETKTSK